MTFYDLTHNGGRAISFSFFKMVVVIAVFGTIVLGLLGL